MVGEANLGQEDALFGGLEHSLTSSSEDHKQRRISCLEDLLALLGKGLINFRSQALCVLLHAASVCGDKLPESLLIQEALTELIKKDESCFPTIIGKISPTEPALANFVSKFVLTLDCPKKKQSIVPLVDFLAKRGSLDQDKDVYSSLVKLGEEGFSKEIVDASSPYLDSSLSKISAIVYSTRLCSRFADLTFSAKMQKLLKRALMGYYGSYRSEIINQVCLYIERTKDESSLSELFNLIRSTPNEQHREVEALTAIMDANASRVDDVLDFFYDIRRENKAGVVINAFEKTKSYVNPDRLLSVLPKDWVKTQDHMYFTVEKIFAKQGSSVKPILFKLLKNDETHQFALQCLEDIGIKKEEIYTIFSKPPLLQIYDYFYSNRKTNPRKFHEMINDTNNFTGKNLGNVTSLDFFMANLFSCFDFTTMIVDSAGKSGVDVIAFNPETLDIFVIGCTVGPIKTDLSTINVIMDDMRASLPEVFRSCKVIPVIVTSLTDNFLEYDLHDANRFRILLLGKSDISKMVDLLYTGRAGKDLLEYFSECFIDQQRTP